MLNYFSSAPLGYEVLLSDYNDFPIPLDQNTYDACLTTLEKADFYILLIGSRVGGYYDQKNRISITRMEYRKAYEMTKAGKTRCIFFVRDGLWKIKEDRKALEDFLKENFITDNEISPDDQKRIIHHQSSFVNDAEVIFDFINEISRDEEMQFAATGGMPFPSANWIRPFTSFRDIVDVLKTSLSISNNLSAIALNTNLKRELVENLTELTQKWKEEIRPSYIWTSFIREDIAGGFSDVSKIPSSQLQFILFFWGKSIGRYNLSTQFIDQALSSGQFLVYNKDKGSHESSLISERLFQLRELVEKLKVMTKDLVHLFSDLLIKYKDLANSGADVSIPNEHLLAPLSLANCQEDVVNLSVALYKALEGDISFLEAVKLNPLSPLPLDAEKLKMETVTSEEIVSWLSNTKRGTIQ